MSRHALRLGDGQLVMLGWDRPFRTFYAQLYARGVEHGVPSQAAGYHPAEQIDALPNGAQYGPYPIETVEELAEVLLGSGWGVMLTPEDMAQLREEQQRS